MCSRGPTSPSILPDLAAGCSMADMADLDSVEAAWTDLGDVIDTDGHHPGDLYQLVRRPQGLLRTARRASFAPAPTHGPCSNGHSPGAGACSFFPDQHLGRNTARRWGFPSTRCPSGTLASRLAATRPRAISRAACSSGEDTARSIRCSARARRRVPPAFPRESASSSIPNA